MEILVVAFPRKREREVVLCERGRGWPYENRDALLAAIARRLGEYPARFYTCHCTGQYAYEYLRERCGNMGYLSCGETVTF